MMTALETSKFLALNQIKNRWTTGLTEDEKEELYRYLIEELRRMLAEE